MIAVIVAKSLNNVIGNHGDLPWYLPDDLKHFKTTTAGQTVVMGRKTYDSIASKLGSGLPNRKNIVITRNTRLELGDVIVVRSPEASLKEAGANVFVIGGGEIYEKLLPHCQRIYATEVDANVTGDTFFPKLAPDSWTEVSRTHHEADEKHVYSFDFVIYDRVD